MARSKRSTHAKISKPCLALPAGRQAAGRRRPSPSLVSRLVLTEISTQTTAPLPVATRVPVLRVMGQVPLSPYVIDLSPSWAMRPPVERQHNLLSRAPADLLDGLRVSFEDVVSQLEVEERAAPHQESWKPMILKPAHHVLWEEIEAGAEHLFGQMQLPETETHLDEQKEEPNKLYTLDDLITPTTPVTVPHLPFTIYHLPFHFSLHPSWKRAVASFVALSFAFVLPIQAMKQVGVAKRTQAQVELAGATAIDQLTLGAAAFGSAHYETAAADFERAALNFVAAEETLSSLSLTADALVQAIPESRSTLVSVSALITIGQNLASAAEGVARALNEIRESKSEDLTLKLTILADTFKRLEPSIAEAAAALHDVELDTLPEGQREKVALLASVLPSMHQTITDGLQFSETIHTLLGGIGTMRYLVLFQNNTELRPTGGFIGSFAEITVRDGKIQELIVPSGGSYDLQGSLTEFVAAPDPLQLLRARWEFQDGNWFPDFPTTAEKLLWFYDHAGGPTVDGVIAINATSVAELLSIVGAIDMPEYGRTIDSENFLFETQKIIEVESTPDEAPKQFIADLAPRLLERIETQDVNSLLTIIQQVASTFASREAQVYVKNPELQKLLDELKWSGRVEMTEGDYVMVVDTNLGGGKTDLVIDEDVQVDVTIATDGTIENTVRITRTHQGLTGALFTGVNNVSFVRLYVPRGSELLAASGDFAPPANELFERSDLPLNEDDLLTLVTGEQQVEPTTGTIINEEFGKTVFGNWMQTKPGATSTIQYTYRLPFTLASLDNEGLVDRIKMAVGLSPLARYSLLVQKQSGALNRKTMVTVSAPPSVIPLWSSDEGMLSTDGTTINNTTDRYFGMLLE